MILGFLQKFNSGINLKGKPTHFKKKIKARTKIHSMREDVHNRWRVGMAMQLAHGVRTKSYDHFADEVCTAIQKVEFRYKENTAMPEVYIDERKLGAMEILMLATNDGFDSLADFLEYFCEAKTYRLLHWTEFRYDGNKDRLAQVNDKFKNLEHKLRGEHDAATRTNGPVPVFVEKELEATRNKLYSQSTITKFTCSDENCENGQMFNPKAEGMIIANWEGIIKPVCDKCGKEMELSDI